MRVVSTQIIFKTIELDKISKEMNLDREEVKGLSPWVLSRLDVRERRRTHQRDLEQLMRKGEDKESVVSWKTSEQSISVRRKVIYCIKCSS